MGRGGGEASFGTRTPPFESLLADAPSLAARDACSWKDQGGLTEEDEFCRNKGFVDLCESPSLDIWPVSGPSTTASSLCLLVGRSVSEPPESFSVRSMIRV